MLLLLLVVAATFAQIFGSGRYDIVQDHVTLDNYSKSHYSYLRVDNLWYNRTTRTFGCEMKLIKEVTDKWWFDIKIFQFRSNEYHPFMPMSFGVTASEVLSRNYMGLSDILEENNVPNKLPIPKGKYRVRNIFPDPSKAPPILIVGKYKVKTNIFDGKESNAQITWFGTIKEKISKSGRTLRKKEEKP